MAQWLAAVDDFPERIWLMFLLRQQPEHRSVAMAGGWQRCAATISRRRRSPSLMARYPSVDWGAVDEVVLGCANQAGEDNRNVARMAALLSGLPETVPAVTVNRLCASGLEAVGQAARAIAVRRCELVIAGGVESMSRAPFVMAKAEAAFGREQKLEDSTLGWRCINPVMQARYGVDSMTQTADNLAREHGIARACQDAYALRSQQRTAHAQAKGWLAEEITPVQVPNEKRQL